MERDGALYRAYAVQKSDVMPGIVMESDVDVVEVGVRREGM